eukprot:6810220-Prymnesium_polylepis.1
MRDGWRTVQATQATCSRIALGPACFVLTMFSPGGGWGSHRAASASTASRRRERSGADRFALFASSSP